MRQKCYRRISVCCGRVVGRLCVHRVMTEREQKSDAYQNSEMATGPFHVRRILSRSTNLQGGTRHRCVTSASQKSACDSWAPMVTGQGMLPLERLDPVFLSHAHDTR